MKFVQTLVSAVVCGFVLMLATAAHAQSTTKQYATIVRIVGQARYSAGDNVWHPLTVGQILGAGNVIQTAADSKVDIVLGDKISRLVSSTPPQPPRATIHTLPTAQGSSSFRASAEQNVIRLRADTVLAIDKLLISNTGVDAVSDTELDLRQGTIFGNVKKLSATSQYLIKIPNGIAGVRGTTFILSADGDITVISGSMVISYVGPNGPITQVLGPGDQYNPATGQLTHLTQSELNQAEQTAASIVTVVEGVSSFVIDQTTVYVSPTGGG